MDNALQTKNYNGLSIGKFVMAIFVIASHSTVSSVFGNFSYAVENLFHICVPFFFISSGYFLYEKKYDANKLLASAKKFFIFYTIWSIIYLPLTVYGEIFWETPPLKAIVKLVKNYICVGVNFYSWQLWYLLADVIAMLMLHFLTKRRLNENKIFIISLCLYLLSIFINFANGNKDIFPSLVNKTVDLYFFVFGTVRTGFFMGFFYISLGMLVSKYIQHQSKIIPLLFLVIGFGNILFENESISKLFQPFLAVGIFMLFLYIKPRNNKLCYVLNKNSSIIYFVHMYFLFLYRILFTDMKSDNFNSFFAFGFTFVLSLICSVTIYFISSKHKSKLTKNVFGI